ncbi:MAG: tRNA lysidine(34) synthetase TilS [Acidobacteriota bacterium]
MDYLYPLFLSNILKFNLIKKNDTIISAFSGGKDSVALILLLTKLQNDISFDLKAAYFNHKIRKDFNEEQAWVENFFNTIGINLIKGSKDIIQFSKKEKLNLENAASISRYDFLKKTAAKFSNSKIATGHSKSDLTETFFIKLFRGSGLQGLSGIYGMKDEKIIRPLLLFSKEEILAFLKRNGKSFYSDYSNKNEMFLRNRIRNTLIPVIKDIEPDIDGHIFKTVSIIQEEFDYFRNISKKILSESLTINKILPVYKIKDLHLSIKRHLIREYIRILKGNLLNISFDHIDNIIKNLFTKKGISVPGIDMHCHKGFLYPENIVIPDYNYEIKRPGAIELKEINSKILIERTDTFIKPENNFTIILPEPLFNFPLIIRPAGKNDKYKKINSSVNQKVFEMIRSSGIPYKLRNLLPVLQDKQNRIIWSPGSPVSDSFKVINKSDKKYILLKFSADYLEYS